MRIIVARCAVDYDGRLEQHFAPAVRLILVKADGSVLVHGDAGSYKPMAWISPPCFRWTKDLAPQDQQNGIVESWTVVADRGGDRLTFTVFEILHDQSFDLDGINGSEAT